jgi:hypothetical protein
MDSVNPVPVNLKVRIVSIALKSFYAEQSASKESNPKLLFYEFNILHQLNTTEKIIGLIIITKVFSDETKQHQVGEIQVEGLFGLENMDEIFKQFSGIPEGVFATFLGILLSTIRGVILVKSEGTVMEGNFFPIVNPMDIIRTGLTAIIPPTQLGVPQRNP